MNDASVAIAPAFARLPPRHAAAAAATAFVVPALLSLPSSPSPRHPETLRWYHSLRQPFFKPPDAAIPIAWTAIEAALAAGAYRLLRQDSSRPRNLALTAWAFNVGMIGAWSHLFFGRRDLPTSVAAAAAMVGTGAAYVAQARKVDRPAAVAGAPFVAWVAFATVLTASIWRLNR